MSGFTFCSRIFFKKVAVSKRSLRHAHHPNSLLATAVGGEGQLIDVLVGIDADALERAFELLEAGGNTCSFRAIAVSEFFSEPVVHGDDLLHVGGNHRTRRAAQRH